MEKEEPERDGWSSVTEQLPRKGYGSGPRWESEEDRSNILWDGRDQLSELGTGGMSWDLVPERSGAEQGLVTSSRGDGGPKVPAWADIRNGSCDRAEEAGRSLLSSQHQPGFLHTSWCSSRAASLQDSASAFLATSGPFFSSRCYSSIFLPEQQQQNQTLPQTGSAQPWLPLPIAAGPLASPVPLSSSACAGNIPACATLWGPGWEGGARSPPACTPHISSPTDAWHSRQGPRGAAPVSLPGVCKG